MNKKTIFITGAGSGLGKESAIRLAKRGHRVIATIYSEDQKNNLQDIAKSQNLDIILFTLDILNEQDRNLILNYDIDVLICNAAIGNSGSVCDIHINKIKEVFETNVFSNIELVQLAIKNWIDKKHNGRIVFLSSLVGRIPFPFLSPYCSSKFAIECFATCLRKELKLIKTPKIEVGIIEPGAYKTGFNQKNIEKKYEWMYTNE